MYFIAFMSFFVSGDHNLNYELCCFQAEGLFVLKMPWLLKLLFYATFYNRKFTSFQIITKLVGTRTCIRGKTTRFYADTHWLTFTKQKSKDDQDQTRLLLCFLHAIYIYVKDVCIIVSVLCGIRYKILFKFEEWKNMYTGNSFYEHSLNKIWIIAFVMLIYFLQYM